MGRVYNRPIPSKPKAGSNCTTKVATTKAFAPYPQADRGVDEKSALSRREFRHRTRSPAAVYSSADEANGRQRYPILGAKLTRRRTGRYFPSTIRGDL